MVYATTWPSFVTQTTDLITSSPSTARYCVRWRNDLGLLVMKVTDDKTCIKFKTRSTAYLNRFEILSRSLMMSCMNKKEEKRVEVEVVPVVVDGDEMEVDTTTAGAGTSSGNGKSKKKKNKKKK